MWYEGYLNELKKRLMQFVTDGSAIDAYNDLKEIMLIISDLEKELKDRIDENEESGSNNPKQVTHKSYTTKVKGFLQENVK